MMTNQYPEAVIAPSFDEVQAYVAAPSQAARPRAEKLRALGVNRQQF
jgi:hypothetical protein